MEDDNFLPYSDWDLENLKQERLTVQEAIKHDRTELKPTLREINKAIKRLTDQENLPTKRTRWQLIARRQKHER